MPISDLPPGAPPRPRLLLKAAAIAATCTALASHRLRRPARNPRKHARRPSPAARARGAWRLCSSLQRAKVPASAMSVVVERVGDPEPLIAWNASRPMMMPASTMKLVTTFGPVDPRPRLPLAHDCPHGRHDRPGRHAAGQPCTSRAPAIRKLVPEELIDLVDKLRKAGVSACRRPVLDKSYFATSTRDSLRSTTMRARRTTSAPIRCCTHSRPCRSPSRRATMASGRRRCRSRTCRSTTSWSKARAVQRGRRGRAPDADGRRRDHDRLFAGDYRCAAVRTRPTSRSSITRRSSRGFLARQQDGGTIAGL